MENQASEDRRELKLDHRHLAFLFLGAAAVCAVFFALGFLVGRGQAYEASLKAQTAVTENGLDRLAPAGDAKAGEQLSKPLNANTASGSSELTPPSLSEKGSNDETLDYHKELDFYSAVKDQKVKENFHPTVTNQGKTESAGRKGTATSALPSASPPPQKKIMAENLVSLQVAALKQSRDAESLAKTLRSKGYPVFLVRPSPESPDKLIRVQIGPFKEMAEMSVVKARLEKDGFKTIPKR
jgi:cell division septation protein DedD